MDEPSTERFMVALNSIENGQVYHLILLITGKCTEFFQLEEEI